MNNEFNELLTSILEEYENSRDANAVIESSCKNAGINDEAASKIQEINELLDAFAQKAESLQLAKEEGESRRQWMESQFDEMTKGRSDEEKTELINEICKATEEATNNILTAE